MSKTDHELKPRKLYRPWHLIIILLVSIILTFFSLPKTDPFLILPGSQVYDIEENGPGLIYALSELLHIPGIEWGTLYVENRNSIMTVIDANSSKILCDQCQAVVILTVRKEATEATQELKKGVTYSIPVKWKEKLSFKTHLSAPFTVVEGMESHAISSEMHPDITAHIKPNFWSIIIMGVVSFFAVLGAYFIIIKIVQTFDLFPTKEQ